MEKGYTLQSLFDEIENTISIIKKTSKYELTENEKDELEKLERKTYADYVKIGILLKQSKNIRGDKTLHEIGELFGLSRERIRQIEQTAIRKLKSPKVARILREYTGFKMGVGTAFNYGV